MPENTNNKKNIAIAVGGIILGAGAIFVYASNNNQATNVTDSSSNDCDSISNDVTTLESTTSAQSGEYANGTYSTLGCYFSPGGREVISVNLTLEDGVVTAVDTTADSSNPLSNQYQSKFKEGVSGAVVGKTLDEIGTLGSVNGSSLTPKGFIDALNNIKEKALAV
jgi:uncharacterized protein with FMN-binding domain